MQELGLRPLFHAFVSPGRVTGGERAGQDSGI